MPPKLRLCLNGSHATYYTPTHLLMAGKTLVGWDKSVGIAAGRSGDRILVGMRFSAPTQNGLVVYPFTAQCILVLFPGSQGAEAWR